MTSLSGWECVKCTAKCQECMSSSSSETPQTSVFGTCRIDNGKEEIAGLDLRDEFYLEGLDSEGLQAMRDRSIPLGLPVEQRSPLSIKSLLTSNIVVTYIKGIIPCVSKNVPTSTCYNLDTRSDYDNFWLKCYWESKKSYDALFSHLTYVVLLHYLAK